MYILSLFEWNEFIIILHSKHTKFDMNDVEKKKKMLNESVWSIEQKYIRIIILHNFNNHWILIMINILFRIINYYSSLSEYHLSNCYEFVKTQMERVDEKLNQKYFDWNLSLEDVNKFFSFISSINLYFDRAHINR